MDIATVILIILASPMIFLLGSLTLIFAISFPIGVCERISSWNFRRKLKGNK